MSTPSSEHVEILRSLTVVVRRGRQISQRTVNDIDARLDPSSYQLLSFLKRNPGATLSELACAQGVSKGTMSRQVARLGSFGFIARASDEHDCRSVRLELTEAGAALVQKMRANQLESLEGALSGWDDADLAELSRLLQRFAADLAESERVTAPR